MTDQSDSPRILLAEDDPGVREVLGQILALSGYSVTAVADGREALKAMAECLPDLLIADVCLPRVDGIELLMYIRVQHLDVPVIAITGGLPIVGDSSRLLTMARQLGARGTLQKPFGMRELIAAVREVLPPGS